MMKNENVELTMKAREHDISDFNGDVVAEIVEAAADGTVTGYNKVEKGIVDGYKKIEKGVVDGYKKIENGVVDGFGKVVDKCVEVLFAREGESVEEAKDRLTGKNKE